MIYVNERYVYHKYEEIKKGLEIGYNIVFDSYKFMKVMLEMSDLFF